MAKDKDSDDSRSESDDEASNMSSSTNGSTTSSKPSKKKENKWSILTPIWCSSVNLVAEFIAAIFEHPRVQEAMDRCIGTSIHAFMEDPQFVDKVHEISSAVVVDISSHHDAARMLGKDSPKLMRGFVGGLASHVYHRAKGDADNNHEPKKIIAAKV